MASECRTHHRWHQQWGSHLRLEHLYALDLNEGLIKPVVPDRILECMSCCNLSDATRSREKEAECKFDRELRMQYMHAFTCRRKCQTL